MTNGENKNPEIFFVLKEKQDDAGRTISAMEYPFNALGGIPSVGDLVKFNDGITYRVYLRNYDYTNIEIKMKIHVYMIKVD